MTQVVLIGREWKLRALLRAQLLEEKIEVEAYETAGDAVRAFRGRFRPPQLVILHLSAADSADKMDELAQWSRRVPVWVIASRNAIEAQELKGRGFELVLFLPIDVGELVDKIKRRVCVERDQEKRG